MESASEESARRDIVINLSINILEIRDVVPRRIVTSHSIPGRVAGWMADQNIYVYIYLFCGHLKSRETYKVLKQVCLEFSPNIIYNPLAPLHDERTTVEG